MIVFDVEIEKKILAYCVSSVESASKIIQENLRTHFYNVVNQNLYVVASQYFKKYNNVLNMEALETLLTKKSYDEATILEYRTIYAEIKGSNPDIKLTDFYIDELKSYSIKRSLYHTLDKGITDLDNFDGQQTLENLVNNIAPLKQIATNAPLVERFVHETVDQRKEAYLYKKEHQEENKGFLTGFDRLDELTNGIYTKELAMFFGRTGTGKSRVLNNVAFNLSKSGSPGIMFSLEMYIEQLERIFDSRGASLSYTKLKKGLLSAEEEQEYFKFLEETKKEKTPLYLVDYSANCTPAFVQSIVREVKRKHNIKWICLDYLTLMTPEGKWSVEHEKYGVLSRELKQLAKSEDIAIITASQSTRKSAKKKEVDTEDVGMSDQITHNCDLIVHLRQDEELKLQNILQMKVVKYRDGESKVSFPLFANFDKNYLGNFADTKGEQDKCPATEVTNQKEISAIPLPVGETETLF